MKKKQLASLYDSQVINDKFLEGHAKKNYHPKTTQSYLMSLRHFYAFSLTCEFCDGISKEQIVALKEKVSRWSSSFRHSSAKRHWEKMEEDLHSLISPEQINEFERSEASREAICLLGQLSGAHCITLTQAQYTLVRDFLIVEISVDNAIRSGALANMTVGEFKKRRKEGEDNVLLIKDHKTLESHGPARIVLSAKLDSWMTIFVREVRSQVTGVTNDDDSRVFLSWNAQSQASDKENIQEVFRDMIEKNAPICKTRIKELLQKESWGRSILKKASLDTVLNRVKYERRLYKNSKNV